MFMEALSQCCLACRFPRRCPQQQRWPEASYRSHVPPPTTMPYQPLPGCTTTPTSLCLTSQPRDHPCRMYPAPGQLYLSGPAMSPSTGQYPTASYPRQPDLPQQAIPSLLSKPIDPTPPSDWPSSAAHPPALNPSRKSRDFWTEALVGSIYAFL